MNDKIDFDSAVLYKACWIFVDRLAKQLLSEDFEILATEMEPEDYGGSFDPAVRERWQAIWESEVRRFALNVIARFIEEEGPWGRGDDTLPRDIASRLRSEDSNLLQIWERSLRDSKPNSV